MNHTKKIVLSAMFIAIGIVLPFFTGQIQYIGNMLLPMHIPVFLCGLICSWQYGAAVGFILPLLRSLLFSMPPLYPNAIAMAIELATYGLVTGFLFACFKRKNLRAVYLSIVPAMLAGRLMWGLTQTALLGFGGKSFTFAAFLAGGFANAVPGIVLQLVLLPSVMLLIRKAHIK